MPARNLKVNLLPPTEFELSFWGRFLRWAVTTGRYIIILTELVVILAFLSRFKLDEDLRNLNEQIETQVGFLESEQNQLSKFFRLQKRLTLADAELEAKTKIYELMDYVAQKTPSEIIIYQYTFAKGEILISATTLNEKSLGNMLTNMAQDRMWNSLDLTQITSDPLSGIKFTLSAKK